MFTVKNKGMQMEGKKKKTNEKNTPQKKATITQHSEMCFAALTLLTSDCHEHISNWLSMKEV